MQQLAFSIIVCTHNRSAYLLSLFDSLKAQNYLQKLYEVIFVDNASTDETPQVISKLSNESTIDIRYVFEPKLGLSIARNTGANAASGEILAYIDDDAIADPGWLAALNEAFSSDDQVVCVGGRIELLWENPKPEWLPEELMGYLGCNNFLGERIVELPANISPFGGNIAVKGHILKMEGGFDPNFGRVGTYLGAHEETRIVDQLRKHGIVIYTPEALVFHCVPGWRATPKYFLKRGYLEGVASSNLAQVRQARSRIGLIRSVIADLYFLGNDIFYIVKSIIHHGRKKTFARLVFTVTRIGQIRQTISMVFR